MSIRDCSNLPDHLVPDWVKVKREKERERARKDLEFRCKYGMSFREWDFKRIRRELDKIIQNKA